MCDLQKNFHILLGFLLISCASSTPPIFDDLESKKMRESFGIDFDDNQALQKIFNDKNVPPEQVPEQVPKQVQDQIKEGEVKEIPTPILATVIKPTPAISAETLLHATSEEEVEEVPQKDLEKIPTDAQGEFLEAFKSYDEKARVLWDGLKLKIRVGEEAIYEISYLGLTVGHINLVTRKPTIVAGEEVYHFTAGMKSASAYRFIYHLDDYLESFVRKSDLLPLKYSLTQRESKQDVDDLQIFDHQNHKTFHWYKRIKKGKETKREVTAPIPNFLTDSYFALHLVRSLPLKTNDIYEFPVVTRGKIWLLKSIVQKVEEIKVDGKRRRALQIKAETSFPGVLSKRGDIIFWFSDDDDRVLLKFKAQVKIGSIEGSLVQYKLGEKLE